MRINEGLVDLEIGNIVTGKGPGKKSTGYYSEAMVISRDLTVLVLKNYFRRPFRALDLLGGSGVRGFRIEKECGADVTINDNNPKSIEIIERNKKLNDSNAKITRYDASRGFQEGYYDYIDIDPYGTPVPYIDISIKSIKRNGIIGITATDLPNLTGTNQKKGIMLYHSKIIRNYYSHESGIRALISYFVIRSAEYEYAALPILSFYGGYYYRVFFIMGRGSRAIEKNMEYVQEIHSLSFKDVSGPLWIGNIHDVNFIKEMVIPEYIKNRKRIENLKEIFMNENILFFYSLEDISRKMKINIPRINDVISELSENGYVASRTQFHTAGIKTVASYPVLVRTLKDHNDHL